jgi:hypothetical protein
MAHETHEGHERNRYSSPKFSGLFAYLVGKISYSCRASRRRSSCRPRCGQSLRPSGAVRLDIASHRTLAQPCVRGNGRSGPACAGPSLLKRAVSSSALGPSAGDSGLYSATPNDTDVVGHSPRRTPINFSAKGAAFNPESARGRIRRGEPGAAPQDL